MTVDCIIEDTRWVDVDILSLAVTAYSQTMRALRMSPDAFEIGLLACDDTKIAELNVEFREKTTATNVLSWPSEERGVENDGEVPFPPTLALKGETFLGDIAIAYETCASEAAEANKTIADHVSHLIVHGILHLIGYDHERDGDATLMENTETKILAQMGIKDPYAN